MGGGGSKTRKPIEKFPKLEKYGVNKGKVKASWEQHRPSMEKKSGVSVAEMRSS